MEGRQQLHHFVPLFILPGHVFPAHGPPAPGQHLPPLRGESHAGRPEGDRGLELFAKGREGLPEAQKDLAVDALLSLAQGGGGLLARRDDSMVIAHPAIVHAPSVQLSRNGPYAVREPSEERRERCEDILRDVSGTGPWIGDELLLVETLCGGERLVRGHAVPLVASLLEGGQVVKERRLDLLGSPLDRLDDHARG